MADREKAVAVAKDVLEQLNAQHPYRAKNRTYISGLKYGMEGDLRDHIEELQKGGCYVCAVGAALMSKARLYDNVPVGKLLNIVVANNYRECLMDVFDRNTVLLMETAFEGYEVGFGLGMTTRAILFGKRFGNATERLRAIMNNIITNNGRFIPPGDDNG